MTEMIEGLGTPETELLPTTVTSVEPECVRIPEMSTAEVLADRIGRAYGSAGQLCPRLGSWPATAWLVCLPVVSRHWGRFA